MERINGLLRDENEKLKKVIESMKKSEETRKTVISEMENGKLPALQVENVIQSLEKMKLWVTRVGFDVASCRFTKPPHSSTALQYRACGECYSGAVLSSTVKSNSPGSMAPAQG